MIHCTYIHDRTLGYLTIKIHKIYLKYDIQLYFYKPKLIAMFYLREISGTVSPFVSKTTFDVGANILFFKVFTEDDDTTVNTRNNADSMNKAAIRTIELFPLVSDP